MRRIYAFYTLMMLGLYGAATWAGWEPGAGKRGLIPAGVRSAPGGYRSYHYWRGGK